jgi:hypothetical protein
MKIRRFMLVLLCGAGALSQNTEPKLGIRETVCDEFQCQAAAYTVKKGKITNWHISCLVRKATCRRLRPFTNYAFDVVNEPVIPECPTPHPPKHPEAACILIHARPFDLNYTMTSLLALCGSNTQDCLSGETYPEEVPKAGSKP